MVEDDFRPCCRFISEYVLGDWGWLMNAAFLHDLSGLLGFACMIVVLVFLRGVFARNSQWRRFAPHMILFLVIVVTAFVLLLSGGPDSFGIAQRVFVTIDVLWIGTVACGLLGTEPARRPEAPR